MPRRSTEPAAKGWLQRLKAYVGELREITAVYNGKPRPPAAAPPPTKRRSKAKNNPEREADRTPAPAREGRLPISAAIRKQMKADAARLLPAHQQPSAAQWRMVFSDAQATCVAAGAGAGKSASLVLRVVLLVQYLQVPLEHISVVTFTRESRKDVLARLVSTLALWGRHLSERQAREVVRTFHSRLLGWAQGLPGQGALKAFETVGQGGAADPDEPPFALALNLQQRELFNGAYQGLAAADPHFASLIEALRRQALHLPRLGTDHPDVRKRAAVMALAAKRDEALCQSVEALWRAAGAWPLAEVEAKLEPLPLRGLPFYCHGYHPRLQAWVMLGVDPREGQDVRRAQAELPLAAEVAVKRTLFQAFCEQPVIWLGTYAAAKALGQAAEAGVSCGPGLEYCLHGERKALPLLDAFHEVGGFIENLGLPVAGAIEQAGLAAEGPDALFFQALARFWPVLQAHLQAQQPPLMTYNRLFMSFSEQGGQRLRELDTAQLERFSHVLVDEFQDVSPLIVNWLKALQAERTRRTLAPGSLLCVGDDWQSIYGWRGSSPRFFLEFEHVFSAAAHARVTLRDNYRSQQGVIDAAEHVIKGTRSLKGKKGRAVGGRPVQPVHVLERDDARLLERVQAHQAQGQSILVLYRKGAERAGLAKLLQAPLAAAKQAGQGAAIRLMTYHSAKGLEADAVFLLGDCQYLGSCAYRNTLYRLAGLAEPEALAPYDDAQGEEALRLAYVAITRARQHCYWFVEPPSDGTALRASAKVAGSKGVFLDQRGQVYRETPN
ncbi:UvrD-helicase domain-containing protein [Pseudomonas typographi]|uniref:UvrD-helicase domain-containing protein n=1 Tax=Pseudomonas typographi TaxID=2715964 RepID=UPI001684F4ED|nr:UvrD-helicase domain-containing protein [Pseudomonas typographi]